MCNFETKFGLVHQAQETKLQRSLSLCCLREALDLSEFEETIFTAAGNSANDMKTTLKLRNFKGRYSLQKFMDELADFQKSISLVRLINPAQGKGKPYAYVVFTSEFAADAFLAAVKESCSQGGRTLLAGNLGKRDVHYAKPQGEKEVLASFPHNRVAVGSVISKDCNTWQA